nr:reverse transcriptase domain-containing protein [Tanacetum cinerariifolium]
MRKPREKPIHPFIQTLPINQRFLTLALTPELGPGEKSETRLTCVVFSIGLEPITPLNEGTSNQNSKSIIEGHMSALKELRKEPSNRDLIKPMLLDFDDVQDVSDESKTAQNEKADETLPHIKERWVSESNAIPNVPELMQISSFMSSHKCPELAKRFSNNVPKKLDEMLKRVDGYLRSEEAFRNTELPKGEFSRKDALAQWVQRGDRTAVDKSTYILLGHQNAASRILATEHQLRLLQPAPLVGVLSKENVNKYYDYHNEKGHSTNDCFHLKQRLKLALESTAKIGFGIQLVETQTMVSGFSREHVKPLGKIELDVCFRRSGRCRRTILKFTVIPAPSPYNIILGHPGLKQLRAVPFTIHGMMKFLTPWGVTMLVSQTLVVFECRREGKKQAIEPSKEKTQDTISPTSQVLVNPAYLEQLVTIRADLSSKGASQLKNLMKKNINIFAWEPSDMTGVPKRIIKHLLNTNPRENPVSQKKRVFCSEKSRVQMAKEDEEKTAFYTDQGTYCYMKMPFGLKNAGATYQRLIDRAFQSQIRRNLEAIKRSSKRSTAGSKTRKATPSTLYGASNARGFGVGLVLISPTKTEYTYALRLNFKSTNNQAEYEALLAGLRIAKKMGVQTLCFKNFKIRNIPQNKNQKADVLRKLASVAFNHLTKEILVETLDVPSMDVEEINAIVEEEGETWMTPIINCLERGVWPKDQNEARALRMKINQYVMGEGVLFKRSYLMPMLRCIGPLQANYVIRKIHMGACNMHLKARSVVAKAIRQGYYWPTMHRDTREEIRKCDSCQIHSPIPKLPKTLMTSIMPPGHFSNGGWMC